MKRCVISLLCLLTLWFTACNIAINPDPIPENSPEGTYITVDQAIAVLKGKPKYLYVNVKNSEELTTLAEGLKAPDNSDLLIDLHIKGENDVTSISNFSNLYNIKSLTLGDNFTTIDDIAFFNCNKLESVVLSTNIKKLGNRCFSDCSNLVVLENEECVEEFGSRTFSGCTSLKEFSFNPNITVIPFAVLCDCSSLEKIIIPSKVTNIQGSAFQYAGSDNLEEIIIPSSVTDIGFSAFSNCKAKKYTYEDKNAFWQHGDDVLKNPNLSTLSKEIKKIKLGIPEGFTTASDFQNNLSSYTSGVVDLKIALFKDKGYGYPKDCEILVKALKEIKTDVLFNIDLYVDENATLCQFSGCDKIKSFKISSGKQTYLPPFKGCTNLESVDIPKDLTFLTNECFQGCTNLKTVNIGEANLSQGIREYVFDGCENLSNESINNILNKTSSNIQMGAFRNCKNLESVNIPKDTTMLSYNCFQGCTNLKTVNIGEANLSQGIGQYAFDGCENLSDESINNILNKTSNVIQNYAFRNCKTIDKICISTNVALLEGAFEGCISLKEVELGTVTSVQKYIFKSCTNLKTITIPKTIDHIIPSVFEGSSLTSIIFEDISNWYAGNNKIDVTNSTVNATNLVNGDWTKTTLYVNVPEEEIL